MAFCYFFVQSETEFTHEQPPKLAKVEAVIFIPSVCKIDGYDVHVLE